MTHKRAQGRLARCVPARVRAAHDLAFARSKLGVLAARHGAGLGPLGVAKRLHVLVPQRARKLRMVHAAAVREVDELLQDLGGPHARVTRAETRVAVLGRIALKGLQHLVQRFPALSQLGERGHRLLQRRDGLQHIRFSHVRGHPTREQFGSSR